MGRRESLWRIGSFTSGLAVTQAAEGRLVFEAGQGEWNKMLVAEDQDDEIEILKIAFSRVHFHVPVHFVRDGEEAVAYLSGEGKFADRHKYPLPNLLLLDLNMPLRNGFEVLEWLRLQPGLRRLAVVVFSSSVLLDDVNRAFDVGASSYLVKPTDFAELVETVRCLEAYWLRLNRNAELESSVRDMRAEMRVLLRNAESGRYFQGYQRWTGDSGTALDFETSERAVHCALDMKLRQFDVVMEAAERLAHRSNHVSSTAVTH